MNLSEQDKDSIVKTLTSQPSQNDLTQALSLFKPSSIGATPATASVIFALVNTTIPELWRSIHSNPQGSREAITLLVNCLSSVSGVNALLIRVDQVHARIQHLAADNEKSQLDDILDVLTLILEGDGFIPSTVICGNTENGTKGKMLVNEYISLVGGSRLLNVVSKVSVDLDEESRTWISDGKKYSKWLGKQLGVAMKEYQEVPEVSTLLGRALSIGYPCTSPFPSS
jgi:acyl-CoA-binding protein